MSWYTSNNMFDMSCFILQILSTSVSRIQSMIKHSVAHVICNIMNSPHRTIGFPQRDFLRTHFGKKCSILVYF